MKVVRRSFSSVLGTLVLVAAGAGGTSCKSHGSPGSAPAGSASAAVEKVPPNADPELYHELSKIAKVCRVDDKQAMVTCPEGDHRKLAGLYISNQRPRVKAIPTLVIALDPKNPQLATVTANLLYSAFRSSWGTDLAPGAVEAKDAQALLTAVLALPKPLMRQSLPAAVHASMLANQSEPLYAELDKMTEPPLRAVAVR